jgi:hypothetical protein
MGFAVAVQPPVDKTAVPLIIKRLLYANDDPAVTRFLFGIGGSFYESTRHGWRYFGKRSIVC